MTHPAVELLDAWQEGSLAESQAAPLAAHVDSCADCRRTVAGLATVDMALAYMNLETAVAPATLRRRVASVVAADSAPLWAARPRALAAGLALALGAASLPVGLALANWTQLLTLTVNVLVWLRTAAAFSVTAFATVGSSLLGAVLGNPMLLAAFFGLLIFLIASGAFLRRRVWLEVRK